MKTYKFCGQNSYTSHRGLDPSKYDAMEASDKPLPDRILVKLNGESVEIDWRDEYQHCEKVTRSGYRILNSGIRLKLEESASPAYHKANGNGSCIQTLTVSSELELEFSF